MSQLTELDSPLLSAVKLEHRWRIALSDYILTATQDPLTGLLAVGTADGTIALYDSNGTSQGISVGHRLGVHSLAFEPRQGRSLLSVGMEGEVCLWDSTVREPRASLRELLGRGRVQHAHWAPFGPLLAVATQREVSQMRGTDGALSLTLLAFPETVAGLAWSHQGQTFAVATRGTLSFWHADGCRCFEIPIQGSVRAIFWSPCNRRIVLVDGGNKLHLVELFFGCHGVIQDAIVLPLVGYGYPVKQLRWGQGGACLATADRQDLGVWHLPTPPTGSRAAIDSSLLIEHTGSVEALAWIGPLLASGDTQGSLRIWSPSCHSRALARLTLTEAITCLLEVRTPQGSGLLVGGASGGLSFFLGACMSASPLYALRCRSCQQTFFLTQSATRALPCPTCGSTKSVGRVRLSLLSAQKLLHREVPSDIEGPIEPVACPFCNGYHGQGLEDLEAKLKDPRLLQRPLPL